MFALVVSARMGNDQIPVRALTGAWASIDEALEWALDNPTRVWKDEHETLQPVEVVDTTKPEEGSA